MCCECPFAKADREDPGVLECRYRPPGFPTRDMVRGGWPAAAGRNPSTGVWPVVSGDDFCGRHPDFQAWAGSQRRDGGDSE